MTSNKSAEWCSGYHTSLTNDYSLVGVFGGGPGFETQLGQSFFAFFISSSFLSKGYTICEVFFEFRISNFGVFSLGSIRLGVSWQARYRILPYKSRMFYHPTTLFCYLLSKEISIIKAYHLYRVYQSEPFRAFIVQDELCVGDYCGLRLPLTCI
jgi:hypothetical protein